MGSVILKPIPTGRRFRQWSATWSPEGKGLPRYPQKTGADMVSDPEPTPPGSFPVGTDTRAPGSWKR